MSPEEIKKELEDRDISMSAVGRRLRPPGFRACLWLAWSIRYLVPRARGFSGRSRERSGKNPKKCSGAGALQSAIFNSANFSSIATDAKGVIQIFNVGAERMLGYTAAEVMNKITPADISDPQEVIARAPKR